jgi:nucleotide-binding universal stress UspA family protein
MTEAITRILVPVDFSAHSDRALRYATTLADRFNATVEVLHVVEDPFVSGAWSPRHLRLISPSSLPTSLRPPAANSMI